MLTWLMNRGKPSLEERFESFKKEVVCRMATFEENIAALQTAVTADEAAIAAVQTFTAAQADKITQLQNEINSGAPDQTKLEALVAELQNDNQALANVANSAVGTPVTPVAPVGTSATPVVTPTE